MAGVLEEGGFWLPSEFFTDEDFVLGGGGFKSGGKDEAIMEFCFPSEFPYQFAAERDELLKRSLVMSTSPQSTLRNWSGRSAGGSSNGSPNVVPSSPTAPFGGENDVVGDLIHQVAGQVARLQLKSGDVPAHIQHFGLSGPPRSQFKLHPATKTTNLSVFTNARVPHLAAVPPNESCGNMFDRHQQMHHNQIRRAVGGMGEAAWTVHQNSPANFSSRGRATLTSRSVAGDGYSAVLKRGCAGTGVFLPRRYGPENECNPYSSDSRQKPVCASSPSLQERNIHPIVQNLDDTKAFVQSHSPFAEGLISDYDFFIARRNEIMLQHRRNILLEKSAAMLRRSIDLPPEWSY